MIRQYINILEAIEKGCPLATQDSEVNEKNRNKAKEEYHYGPKNLDDTNDEFWNSLAAKWEVDTDIAKTRLCGNCKAFDTSPDMLRCIGDETGEVGYCTFLEFTCSAKRTCEKWIEEETK